MTNPLDIPPTHRTRPQTGPALLGAAVGALALAGVVVGLGAVGAGADDTAAQTSMVLENQELETSPIEEDWRAFDECIADRLGDLWIEPDFDLDGGDFDDADFDPGDSKTDEFGPLDDATFEAWDAADEACAELLPSGIKAEIAAWEPFDVCIDEQLGIDENTTDEGFDAISDDVWQAAEATCFSTLPPEIQDEILAFDAFDECLVDQGVSDGDDFRSVVQVDGPDGFSMIEFGAGGGTVTVTGNDDQLSVSTSGDVSVFDDADLDARWESEEAAFEMCEALLPDVAFHDDLSFDDEFEGDDELDGDDEFDVDES